MLGLLSESGRATYKGWPVGPISELDHHRATFGPPLDIEPQGALRARALVAPMISDAVAFSISGRPGQNRARIGPSKIGPNAFRQRGSWPDLGQNRAKRPDSSEGAGC
jgi:hypothetical protein